MSQSHRPLSAIGCQALHPIRHRYTPADSATKLRVLHAIAAHGVQLRSFDALTALQNDLLFLRAFPDSVEVFDAAGHALRRIEPALKKLSARQRALADDTGMIGSTTRYTPSYDIARWLAERAPVDADIDWDALDDLTKLDALLRPLLQRGEEDGFENGALGTREWIDLARDASETASKEGTLAWLMAGADHSRARGPSFEQLYDEAALPVRWRLAGSTDSVTGNALTALRVAPRTGMRRPDARPARAIAQPLDGIELLAPKDGARVVDAARATLAARARSVYAMEKANPSEVWMAPLGEGVTLAIIGVRPYERLSLESNYGYVLFSNGVPIGYGGVTPLFGQANTGINIFDPFRGSEGAFLWTQMLRAFASLFGIKRFVVDAVQFGDDNEEAIASGAYWFYWRLGFRAHDPAVRALAEREAARLAKKPGTRSSARTLKRLATGTLHLTLPGCSAYSYFNEQWLTPCSALVTKLLEHECPHDHASAARTISARVAKRLGVRTATWSASEKAAFKRLAPVVELLGDLVSWSAIERRSLGAMMRAKGGAQEALFVELAQAHPRFYPELIRRLRRATL